jgi:hypothetical protein
MFIFYFEKNVCAAQSPFILCIEHTLTAPLIYFIVVSLNCKQTDIDQNKYSLLNDEVYILRGLTKKNGSI